jgi:hypothetical protein
MRRQGVPKCATTCLFNTLQETEHQVRITFGDSVTYIGGQRKIQIQFATEVRNLAVCELRKEILGEVIGLEN